MKTYHIPIVILMLLTSFTGVSPEGSGSKNSSAYSSEAHLDDSCTWQSHTCCDHALYTPLKYAALRRYMVNYRDHVWSKTSPYFSTHPLADPSKVLCDKTLKAAEGFDARYLDVSIEQLENYICQIKNMGVCEESKEPDMLRIYYLRYDSKEHLLAGEVPENFHNSHTLGFTPLLSTDVWNRKCFGPLSQIPIWIPEPGAEPPSANHNQICPPLDCDHLESMIVITDCGFF